MVQFFYGMLEYLFKHFYAQKLLILLIGREYLEGWIEKWETCSRNIVSEKDKEKEKKEKEEKAKKSLLGASY